MTQNVFFQVHVRNKLFRRYGEIEIVFQGKLDKPLRLLALTLVQEFSEFFSESKIQDLKGRDRNQRIEIPGQADLFNETPEGEILSFSGSLLQEEEDIPDPHETILLSEGELNDDGERQKRLVQYDILARQSSSFLDFPSPSHIAFSLRKDLFPLQFTNTSFFELLQNEDFHVKELRFAVQEFETVKSFFGPSPTVVHELLCEAKESCIRVRLQSERHDGKLHFPYFASERAARFVSLLKQYCPEFATEIDKHGKGRS